MHLAGVHRLASSSDYLLDNKMLNTLRLERGRAFPERVRSLLLHTLVRRNEVTQHLGLVRRDDACVDIRARAEIVEDTG